MDQCNRERRPDAKAVFKRRDRGFVAGFDGVKQLHESEAALAPECPFRSAYLLVVDVRQKRSRPLRLRTSVIAAGTQPSIKDYWQMSTNCSGEPMRALQKSSVEQGRATYSAAQRDHHGILCATRRAKTVLTQKCEARIVFYEERHSKRSLTPGFQIKFRRIIKFLVGGEHTPVTRIHNAAETKNNGRTSGAINPGGMQTIKQRVLDCGQMAFKIESAVCRKMLTREDLTFPHNRASSMRSAEVNCENGQRRQGSPF